VLAVGGLQQDVTGGLRF